MVNLQNRAYESRPRKDIVRVQRKNVNTYRKGK